MAKAVSRARAVSYTSRLFWGSLRKVAPHEHRPIILAELPPDTLQIESMVPRCYTVPEPHCDREFGKDLSYQCGTAQPVDCVHRSERLEWYCPPDYMLCIRTLNESGVSLERKGHHVTWNSQNNTERTLNSVRTTTQGRH